MTTSGHEVYKKYLSLRLHFTSESYDFFKYNRKSKDVPFDTYLARKDRFFFEKISKKYPDEYEDFFVANMVSGINWPGDMIGDEKVYADWKRTKESLKYKFKTDISFTLI